MEENGKIHSLDCLITRDKNCSRIAVYRRSTHSDRLLDQTSYNPTTPHKATTTRALTKRVQTVGGLNDSLAHESTYLNNVFNLRKTTIPCIDFFKRNTYTEQNDTSVLKLKAGIQT